MMLGQPRAVAPRAWSRTELTALAGILASAISLFLALMPINGLALTGALIIACVSTGAAVMCWVDSGDGVLQAGLTLVLSLALTAIASTVMIWLSLWHPKALLVFPLACVVSTAAKLHTAPWHLPRRRHPARSRGPWPEIALLCLSVASWGYGVSQYHRQSVGLYGILASADFWFYIGLAAPLVGALIEINRSNPRTWLLAAYLAALIVAMYATVPLLYGLPEYSWAYKHIGMAQELGVNGRVIDPSDIYEEWPALFAAVAAVSGISHVSPLSFAAWAPMAFELADALLLLCIFRALGVDRRVTWTGLFMYEGLVAWVQQDYLSPQAFSFTLWLGIAAILIRWMLAMAPAHMSHRSLITRLRSPFLRGLPEPAGSTGRQRSVAVIFVLVIFFAIVAAHQLTPYLAIAAVAALTALGLLRRGWLLLLSTVVIAGGFLASRYSLISQQFGGLFSGGDPLQNGVGVTSAYHPGAEAINADIVRVLGASMWLVAAVIIALNWRRLGRVVIPAAFGFSSFAMLFFQDYGGEAIYRVFLFSAPWCALIIASALFRARPEIWRITSAAACLIALAAGLQGLWGATTAYTFTPAELNASLWLYSHAPSGSLLLLPANNFPDYETANSNNFNLEIIPGDLVNGPATLNEGNVTAVEKWIKSWDYRDVYVVFSGSMVKYYSYYGTPQGYAQLETEVRARPGWTAVYHDSETTIYRVASSGTLRCC